MKRVVDVELSRLSFGKSANEVHRPATISPFHTCATNTAKRLQWRRLNPAKWPYSEMMLLLAHHEAEAERHVRRWGVQKRSCSMRRGSFSCTSVSFLSYLVVCEKGLEILVGCRLLGEIQGRGHALVRLLDLIKPVGNLHNRHSLRFCPHHLVDVRHHPAWCYPRSRRLCLANPWRARSDVPRAAHGGCEREAVG